jgi:hypothetical protein
MARARIGLGRMSYFGLSLERKTPKLSELLKPSRTGPQG